MNESPAQMSLRHKKEWQTFRENVMGPAISSQDPDQIKAAKALADVLKTYQEGERKAYDDNSQANPEPLIISWAD